MLSTKDSGWQQIAVKVSAKTSEGLVDLAKALDEHRNFLANRDVSLNRSKRLREELIEHVTNIITSKLVTQIQIDPEINTLVEKLLNKGIDPDTAASQLASKYLRNGETCSPEK